MSSNETKHRTSEIGNWMNGTQSFRGSWKNCETTTAEQKDRDNTALEQKLKKKSPYSDPTWNVAGSSSNVDHLAASPFADVIMNAELVEVKKPITNPYDGEGTLRNTLNTITT
jgi:hypothetical protein